MKHEQIEKLMFFVNPDTKNVVGVPDRANPKNEEDWFLAFGPRTIVHPEIYNLLVAAPIMYQTLSQQFIAIGQLLDVFEQVGQKVTWLDKLQNLLIEMQDAIVLAQQVGQLGTSEVIKMMNANKKA